MRVLPIAFLIGSVAASTHLSAFRDWTSGAAGQDLCFVYPDTLLEAIGPSLQIRVIDTMLAERSLSRSVPLLEYDSEVIRRKGENVRIRAGAFVSRTATSVTIHAENVPDLMLVYRTNCDAPGNIHPLMRDFIFRRELKEEDCVVRALMLSPPARLEMGPITLKTDFGMSLQARAQCASGRNAHVRFLLSERHHISVSDLIETLDSERKPMGLALGMRLLETLMIILERLHSRSVVHGNINTNTVVRVVREGLEKTVLSHFDFAFFEEEIGRAPPAPADPVLDTPWRLVGEPAGYRDDVFRAVELVALGLNGSRYAVHCRSLDERALLRFKREAFLFSHVRLDSTLVLREDAETIRNHFSAILLNARSPSAPNAKPEYAAILAHIRAIQAIVDATGSPSL